MKTQALERKAARREEPSAEVRKAESTRFAHASFFSPASPPSTAPPFPLSFSPPILLGCFLPIPPTDPKADQHWPGEFPDPHRGQVSRSPYLLGFINRMAVVTEWTYNKSGSSNNNKPRV